MIRVRRIGRLPWLVVNSTVALPLGCVAALAWANLAPEPYYRFSHAVDFVVNDIGLALFLGVMTKQVVEETLRGGVLHSWRNALLPIVAAIGGILVPIPIYFAFLDYVAEPMLASAWAVTSAIDVGLCFLIGRVVFGRHPAVPVLVLISMVANAIGLAIIAAMDPPSTPYWVVGCVVVAICAGLAMWLRRRRVRSFWPYLLGPGVLCWAGLYLAGVHPALALVPVVPFMPHARRDPGLLEESPATDHTTLSRFEHAFGPSIQPVLFLFGLVNAGVPLHGIEPGMWALPVATLIGRPIGVFAGAIVAARIGLRPTVRIGLRELVVIGIIASTGLTMALFFTSAVMATGSLQLQMRVGALLTSVGAPLGVAMAWALGVGRFHHRRRTVQAEATL
jgi:NhaA family Na+:H+ antiporter